MNASASPRTVDTSREPMWPWIGMIHTTNRRKFLRQVASSGAALAATSWLGSIGFAQISKGPARAVINQNFLFGVFFIIGGWTAGAFGYLNPIIAAILHNAGSLVVVFNSARLVRLGEELEPFQAVAADLTDKGTDRRLEPAAQLAPGPASA